MKFLNRINRHWWEIADADVPWDVGSVPLYDFIRSLPPTVVPVSYIALPDADRFFKGSEIRWADGAMDSLFPAPDESQRETVARKVLTALIALSKRPTSANARSFYDLLLSHRTGEYVDKLVELMWAKSLDLLPVIRKIEKIAIWLTTRSPDREPVKLGIQLIAQFSRSILQPKSNQIYRDMMMSLGRHDELSLYAMDGLCRALREPDDALWQLAKAVHGWGRIHLVTKLSTTSNPEIRRWLLRHGYRNTVMYQYLAYSCATGGQLKSALSEAEVDDQLMTGAGDIIEALLETEPEQGIRVYVDGIEVMRLYLSGIADRPLLKLEWFGAIHAASQFVGNEKEDWEALATIGWNPEIRRDIALRAESIMRRSEWREMALRGIEVEETTAFEHAAKVAAALGIDTWRHRFERQVKGIGSNWYHLMQTNDEHRIEQVLELAEQSIPLAEIATGPAELLGLGEKFSHHQELDWIVQELGRFPGHGWNLIQAGLRSPVIRNRNMALNALSSWSREHWPPDAIMVLRDAARLEPDEEVRERFRELLGGEREWGQLFH